MKYGMRERLSGAIIVIALAVIFVPMLFDEPAPREERPQPVLTIEQPIEIERRPVAEPEPPSSLGDIREPQPLVDSRGSLEVTEGEPSADAQRAPSGPEQSVRADPAISVQSAQESPRNSDEPADQAAPPETQDPIADLARAADQRGQEASNPSGASAGEWAVQAGSFGEPGNAERLEAQLREQGFDAYRRQREGGLTSVYVGPYASSDAGEQARTQLKERANIQGLLVRAREG